MPKKITTKSGQTRWEVRFRAGGRGTPQVKRRFDRKEDAERFETEARRAKQLGAPLYVTTTMTLDEYASEWWERAEPGLAKTTRKSYIGALTRYVLPRLGHVRLSALAAPVVNHFKNTLVSDGKGADTVRYALAVLSAICADAVVSGYLPANPCHGVKRPTSKRKRAIRPLAPVDVEKLRDKCPTDEDALLVSVLAYGGLRPEEALALTWPDIREKLMIIDKAVTFGETKDTKTSKTRTVEMLDVLQADFAAYRKSLPVTPGPGSLVFPHPRDPSRPWGDTTYRNWRTRVFKQAAEDAGLGDVNPYDLRHSFVSLHLMSGRRPREVAEQAGHSVAVMESTYSHILEEFRGVEMTDPSTAIRKARDAVAKEREESVA